jgi:hypothetical protein
LNGVRWWLNTDHGRFSVDNASVGGIDCSSLDPTIWMVQWQDGRGEIEHQVDKDTNDNGLRENFIDVIPYAPFFQQFLARCPRLTLTQAKKIDVDLIRQIFESKRQAPFHYPVAAGDFYWDATDETLMSSTVAAIQNATASLNQVIAALNSVVAHFNSNFVGIINQNAGYSNTLVAQINSAIVNAINSTMVAQINAIVDAHNNTVNTDNSYGNSLVAYINGILGGFGVPETISGGLQQRVDGVTSQSWANGISVAIATCTIGWNNPYSASYVGGVTGVGPGTFNNASAAPYTPIPAVSVANAQWIPIGATAPVTVTPAEQAAILNGITARTNDLNAKKNIKIGEVNALTTVDAVIAYDVTSGW